MVLFSTRSEMDDTMPQTVPSAGFTPPCDYSNFADNFDLSLLPGGDQPVSPSTQFYPQSYETEKLLQPKILTSFYPSPTSDPESDLEQLAPDFQTLLVPTDTKKYSGNIYLEVPSPYSPISQGLLSPNDQFSSYRETNYYPSSPEQSVYTPSPSSVYSTSPCGEEYLQKHYIKKETSPVPNFAQFSVKEESYILPTSPASYTSNSSDNLCIQIDNSNVLDLLSTVGVQKEIKKEAADTFGSFQRNQTLRQLLEKDSKSPESQTVPEQPKDHLLLREALRDTSFQKKFNIRPIDFGFLETDIKMEEPEQDDLMRTCNEEIVNGNIEPVLNMAIEQMRKDVDNTCATLGISADPSQWDSASVLSWIRWTSRQFSLQEPVSEQWDMSGATLITLSDEDFTRRSPQGGMILHAQLEIWKAAYSEEDLGIQWKPETTSSNASSGGDLSDDEEEDISSPVDTSKPTTSRSGSHIHLWQFLKELLASPQTYVSCIRWIDRSKGIFKIEDSVKVARLWGKRKNRPAMNYDKLSRSIRQYYKKGIMKKTERSQRLVYQFCHPYCL
ncbi:DNA-binding protein D-ETS-4 isoform X1 [Diabrotica virgifera virgifera]|uniref:DNA-binding protein D-ETS-4 n=2 Tax=Diabrotica virgifera virgifera TaxID=50390 RepID=A0ABM5JUN8_DIAVI|nr:DNA-binding protein D-ETS-4 isoform X1 [Diabrotica virgifera virgifera]